MGNRDRKGFLDKCLKGASLEISNRKWEKAIASGNVPFSPERGSQRLTQCEASELYTLGPLACRGPSKMRGGAA